MNEVYDNKLRAANPSSLGIGSPLSGGSGDHVEAGKAPQRQYRIYSNDVPPLLSSPFDDVNDDSISLPLPDDNNGSSSRCPNAVLPNDPSCNDSDNNARHPYPNRSPAFPKPTRSPSAAILPPPIPSALSWGASLEGVGAGEMAGLDVCDGGDASAVWGRAESHTCTSQTRQENYNTGSEMGVADGVANGVADFCPGSIAISGNEELSAGAICIIGKGGGDVAVMCDPAKTITATGNTENEEIIQQPIVIVTGSGASELLSVTSLPPAPPAPFYHVRDESSLNRADLAEIWRHEDILDRQQVNLLKMVGKKIDKHPQRYDRDNYRETSAFLILSNWPSVRRLAFCGIPSAMNPSGQCRLHQFCPYCCWKERNAAQLRYVPSYYDGTWHFLTGSFTGELRFAGQDGYDWLHYWNAYKVGLAALVNEGLIDGAYWVEELAVNSFLPTMVLPHVHAIIDAPELTDATLELLKDTVNHHLENSLGMDFLPPNVKSAAIQDQKGLFDRIGYMLKPMKLLRAYETAWVGASFHNRARVWELNSQLTDLVGGHSQFTRRRPKMQAKGTLNPKCREFIGVHREDHGKREYQELINEMKKLPVEFIQDVAEAEM
jgi:hypothetical protein